MKFATRAIHVGSEPDPMTGALMPPIYLTSTYVQEKPGETKGYEYTRGHNPNFSRLEKVLASLEGAKHATVFSSGIGALASLVSTLSQGDSILGIDGLYGGSYRLFCEVFSRFGIQFSTINSLELEPIEAAVAKKKPTWLFFETPTNPLMGIIDIAACVKIAKKYGATVVIDNTFASPFCQNPLQLGADLVWHSTTKYLSGHSDVLGGVAMTNDSKMKDKLDLSRKSLGTNPSPFDCWLIMRGVKTLAIRMEQHQKNAFSIAQFFEKHPKVKRVYYPGIPSHPQHEIAKKQMHKFSGMMAVEFDLSKEQVEKLVTSFRYFSLGESLGGIESLVNYPRGMTHANIPEEERLKMGISDAVVRFSIGIEAIDDLIDDLEQALAAI